MIPKKPLFAGGLVLLFLVSSFFLKKDKVSIKTENSDYQKEQQVVSTNNNMTSYKEEKQSNNQQVATSVVLSTKKDKQKNIKQINKSNDTKQINKINKSNNGNKKIKSVIPEKDTKSEKKVISTKTNYGKNFINSGSRFYGKANIYIGYGLQQSSYNVTSKVGIKNEYSNASNSLSKTNKNISGVLILNYNFYYKLSNLIHPFIGIDVMTKYPFSSKDEFNFNINNDNINDISGHYNVNITDSVKINEYGRINAKLGTKINLHKNISIDPYALAGFNVTRNFSLLSKIDGYYRSKRSSSTHYNVTREASSDDGKMRINFVYGGGVDIVLFDKYIVGMEYYNYRVHAGHTLIYEGGYKDFSLKTKREKFTNHNILIKFGVRF